MHIVGMSFMRFMKFVIISADNKPSVYSVPNLAADNLNEILYYCKF